VLHKSDFMTNLCHRQPWNVRSSSCALRDTSVRF